MQSQRTALTCAFGALLLSGAASTFAPRTQTADPQIAALKTEVDGLKAKIEGFEKFLSAQEKAGKELADALARSEAEGFTAGINPGSREILLKGLRTQAEAMQAGASEDADDGAPKGKNSMRGRRRGR